MSYIDIACMSKSYSISEAEYCDVPMSKFCISDIISINIDDIIY